MLGLCLVVSPQLLGGAFGWAISIIAVLAALACGTAAWAARVDGASLRLDRPSLALMAIFGWTVLQLVPLPRALTHLAQPRAVQMADTAAELLGDSPSEWVSLTLDPGGTRAELVKGAAILSAFMAAWLLVLLGHRRRVLVSVGLSTVAMAAVALGHLIADADRVFGVHAQIHTSSMLVAPLLNQNQLSGFLAMGVPVLLGLAMEEDEDRGRRLGLMAGAVLVGATSLLAISRGGVAGLVCGVFVVAVLGLMRRRRGGRALGTAYGMLTTAAGTIAALGLYLGFERLFRDFEASDVSKLELGARGASLALDHPWFGVGRGAFSAAFVSQHGSTERFTHPENLIAQWTSEWGLVASAALLAVLGAAVIRSVAGATKWSRLGAAAGLASLVVHDLVDFALEMAGVAVVAAALLAAVIAPRRSSRPAKATRRGPEARHVATGTALAAVALVVTLGWRLDAESVLGLQRTSTEAMTAGSREAFRSVLVEAIRLHPSEPVFPLLGGAEAVRNQDPRAVAWLNRAMLLAPGWSSPHLETARFLVTRRRIDQALLELREVEARQPGAGNQLTCTILTQRPEQAEALVRIAGEGTDGTQWLDRTAACLPLEHPASGVIDGVLVARGVLQARLRRANQALRAHDPASALRLLEPVQEDPSTDVQLLRAQACLARQEPHRAIEVLEQAERFTEHLDRLLRLRAEAETRAGDEEAMRATMQRLRGHAGGSSARLAAVWVREGNHERALGNSGRALAAYERAHRLDPYSSGLEAVARLAEQTGDLGRALRANQELCQRAGPDAPACRADARIRRRLDESPPPRAQPPSTP